MSRNKPQPDAAELRAQATRHAGFVGLRSLCGFGFRAIDHRESLRDIEACLGSRRRLLYHSGIRGTVKRCNLAYANEHRDARIFGAIAAVLMRRATRLYADHPTDLGLDGDLFAVDASLIDLSLALFRRHRQRVNLRF